MATIEEYKAVHGQEPPAGKTAATEFGDGGCNVIYKDKGAVVGRWSSWDDASVALGKLQTIGLRWEYRLEESHHWVSGLGRTTRCSLCGKVREFAGAGMGLEWPVAR